MTDQHATVLFAIGRREGKPDDGSDRRGGYCLAPVGARSGGMRRESQMRVDGMPRFHRVMRSRYGLESVEMVGFGKLVQPRA